MNVFGRITGTLAPQYQLEGTVSSGVTLDGNLTIPSTIGAIPYEGDYEITPTAEAQTLATASKYMIRDIVINPVPSNYGLITWNGSTLTVS